ncbi:MAG TPA: AMP-binding protein [Ilumatobacteraceae bacterium]
MNLAHLIDDHAGDSIALFSRGRPTTYGELREQVDSMRGGLAGLGIGRGDRVAIVCNNSRYFVVAYLAVLGLGAAAVPLNPTSPAPEIAREITAVGAKAAIVDPVAASAWAVIAPACPSVEHVVATDGSVIEGAVGFDELLSHTSVPIVEVEPDTLAVLIFTSGTAGSPRAAMLTHGNLRSNIDQSRTAVVGVQSNDVVYGVLPLNHIFGLNVVLGLSLARGATVVLVNRFDPATALDTIRERGVTVVPGAPPMWIAWSQFEEAPADSFASVRLALTGAAKMPEDAIRRLEQRFGLRLSEGYGLTEASPTVTSSAGLQIKPGSIGKVLDGIEVRLVDDQGDDVVSGDPGEIWVRGPNVFAGYFEDPEATARALTADGWLRTGDIAVTDGDGYLYLVDRAKDLIIVSGFNVYPAEVEEILAMHPGVDDVAVVGVPHPYSGEAVKAYVVQSPGAHLDEEQLIAHCTANLARYKCPSKILFVDELPRGVAGKLLRRELR